MTIQLVSNISQYHGKRPEDSERSTMSTLTESFSRMQSVDGVDLAHIHSMPQLLAALHGHLRTISTPLSYDQLQKNENVLPK